MKILIAGASGFIGRNLLLRTSSSWRVYGIYHQNLVFPKFLKENGLHHVQAVHCDLRDTASVKQNFKDNNEFDCCLFMMGNSDIGLSAVNPQLDCDYNITTLLNLISNVKVKRFIFMSSGAVYLGHTGRVGPHTPVHPLIPYGINKVSAELFVRFFQEKTDRIGEYVILRFFGAYGPMELSRKIYTKLIKTFCVEKKNEFTVIGNGKNFIDAMYIDDTVTGLLKVISSRKKDLSVDFCKGDMLTIDGLVRRCADILGLKRVKIIHQGKTSEHITFHASPLGMQKHFGFRPHIPLEQGMKAFAQYYCKNNAP